MSKGGGGGGSQTTTVNPWAGSIPSLNRGLEQSNRLMDQNALAPRAYSGDMVANFNPTQMQGFNSITNAAQDMSGVNRAAGGSIVDMLGAGNFDRIGSAGAQGLGAVQGDIRGGGAVPGDPYAGLDDVRANVLGGVIPQVSSMFSDTGGLDSSAAMDTIGRAASQALAPIEYDAFNRAQDRDFAGRQAMLGRSMDLASMSSDAATRGATLAPSIAGMQFLPGQMMGQVGGQMQGQAQNELNAQIGQFNQNASQPYDNLVRYMQLAQGTAGLGGTTMQPYNGPSSGQQAVGGALGGAAAGASIGGPWGALAGGGLGLLGAFL